MTTNLEQQIVLEKMRDQYFMDMMHANYANQQTACQSPSDNGMTYPRLFHDASTNTFDLLLQSDVEMKPIP